MKKVRKLLTGIAMTIVAVAFASCNSISQADAYNGRVDYMEGLNYFFNTNAPKKVPEKITSQRMFDKYFSPATTMGKGGEATEINFKTHFVVPVVLPETNRDTKILLQNMYAKTPDLTLNYGVKVGAVRTYTTQPSRVVIKIRVSCPFHHEKARHFYFI